MFWDVDHCDGSNMAVYDEALGRNITYRELDQESSHLSSLLRSNGKELALLFSDNSYWSVLVYLSMLRSGKAVFISNAKMDLVLKAGLIKNYRPDLIWSVDSQDGFEGYSPFVAKEGLRFFRRQGKIETPIHPDLAVLLSTSGTTGSPKTVRLSYANLQANAESIAEYLDLSNFDRAITMLPSHYSYGLSVINSHLLVGATLVCTNRSVMERPFWELFRACACTSFAGVPFTYQMLDRLRFARMDLPSLRYMTQAGGRLHSGLIEKFLHLSVEKGIRFFVMYGGTEATARISYVPFDALPSKIGSIGIPIPKGAMLISDGKEEMVGPNQEGELVYKGPNVMMGYAEKREDLSRGDVMDGVLCTGDLAYKDQDGYFFLTGRLKRFLKIFGLRLNLDDVEEMLESRLSKAVACAGVDDKLRIFVETKKREDLEQAVLSVVRLYGLHHSAVSAAERYPLPRTASGKKDYTKLESMQSDGQPDQRII